MAAALESAELVGGRRFSVSAKWFRESNADHSGPYVTGCRQSNRTLSKTSWRIGMRRREFIILPAKSLGGLLLYTLAGEPLRLQAQNGDVKIPLRFFTNVEARVVEA